LRARLIIAAVKQEPLLSRDREGAVLIIPAVKQEPLLSRDREGAVLFADSAEFCKPI